MNLCVGIPSYNEAKSISFVTGVVDRGIARLRVKCPDISEGIIINADNSSHDGTRDRFLSTTTKNRKISIATKGLPGKGKNVLAIFKRAVKEACDIIVTVDADLTSITPEWIDKFALPVLRKQADFVYPEYKRSRFEGSTTNHLAYPMIYAYFGKDIRQPIAGDFAFSNAFIKYILKQPISKSTKEYGIDMFLSMSAAASARWKIGTAILQKKMHKPSFPRIEKISTQELSSALEISRRFRRKKFFAYTTRSRSNIVGQKNYAHKNRARLMRRKEIIKILALLKEPENYEWLTAQTRTAVISLLKNEKKFNETLWAEVLGDWHHFGIHNKVDSTKHAAALFPLFFVRTVDFWDESESKTSAWVEWQIRHQAILLKKYLDRP